MNLFIGGVMLLLLIAGVSGCSVLANGNAIRHMDNYNNVMEIIETHERFN